MHSKKQSDLCGGNRNFILIWCPQTPPLPHSSLPTTPPAPAPAPAPPWLSSAACSLVPEPLLLALPLDVVHAEKIYLHLISMGMFLGLVDG
eukprot:1153665-Pelagomonas_calceolata.AAC.4